MIIDKRTISAFFRWYFYHGPSWFFWRIKHREELKAIKRLKKAGHHSHCSCRQIWGDGECECDLYKNGYEPYAWMKEPK